ncbi:pirin family protein [Terricaulis silvestris]|uniref:pirin family protein n=1 Tax=Terricaulis silvestris TaxID=2686094 RepID=UPI00389A107C
MVGPFIFWDEFGPAQFEAGKGMDVRPHPHINLATVTYLFEGEIFHRDILGSAQAILPGDVNWMNAGRDRAFRAHRPRPARQGFSDGGNSVLGGASGIARRERAVLQTLR